jgi:hypothetical protein
VADAQPFSRVERVAFQVRLRGRNLTYAEGRISKESTMEFYLSFSDHLPRSRPAKCYLAP